jgi:hypothetical protein
MATAAAAAAETNPAMMETPETEVDAPVWAEGDAEVWAEAEEVELCTGAVELAAEGVTATVALGN